ncbi:hypothetical protein ACJW30_01G369100 [Castanea mollissima]
MMNRWRVCLLLLLLLRLLLLLPSGLLECSQRKRKQKRGVEIGYRVWRRKRRKKEKRKRKVEKQSW